MRAAPRRPLVLDAEPRKNIMVAVVNVGGTLRVVDVIRGRVFRNRSGGLASVDDIVRDPQVAADAARDLRPHDVPYGRYFRALPAARVVFDRMEHQKPWPRLKHEVSVLLRAPAHWF
jgi:hypothetical protein